MVFSGSFNVSWLLQLAMKTRCTGMMFVVAENNEPSVQFYKRRGAEDLSEEEGWRLFRFDKDSLVKMATPSEEWQEEPESPAAPTTANWKSSASKKGNVQNSV